MILNFTDPFFTTRVLGFEPLFDRLQRLSESNERSSSYPPYNISKDGNLFAIEIAVAGLSKEDIQIELADGVLTISYDGPNTEVINGENMREVYILPKKPAKLGFFEKMFHLFS